MVCHSSWQRYKNIPLDIRKISSQSSSVYEPRTILSHYVKLLSLVQILHEFVEVVYITATLRIIAKCGHNLAFKRFQATLHCASSCLDWRWNSTRLLALFPHKSWQKTSNKMSASRWTISPRLTLYCTILHAKQEMKTEISRLTIRSVNRFGLTECIQMNNLRNCFKHPGKHHHRLWYAPTETCEWG